MGSSGAFVFLAKRRGRAYRIGSRRLGDVEVRNLDLGRDREHYADVFGLHLSGREGRAADVPGRT
jgi:hypothetical protein